MNRSRKGFGLTGVAVAVAVMIVMAIFSTSSQAQGLSLDSAIQCSELYGTD
jgi:type II secretory pathway component PulK